MLNDYMSLELFMKFNDGVISMAGLQVGPRL